MTVENDCTKEDSGLRAKAQPEIAPLKSHSLPCTPQSEPVHRIKNLTAHFLNAERGELENSPTES